MRERKTGSHCFCRCHHDGRRNPHDGNPFWWPRCSTWAAVVPLALGRNKCPTRSGLVRQCVATGFTCGVATHTHFGTIWSTLKHPLSSCSRANTFRRTGGGGWWTVKLITGTRTRTGGEGVAIGLFPPHSAIGGHAVHLGVVDKCKAECVEVGMCRMAPQLEDTPVPLLKAALCMLDDDIDDDDDDDS